MDFRILGPLEVYDGDRPVALGGIRQRALLGMLLLHANEVVSTDRLIDELRGGEKGEDAAKAIQVAISRLRKIIDPARAAGQQDGVLVTRAPGYELRVGPDQLDLHRFERLAADGREALVGGDFESASRRLSSALALWRGAPLADLAYESFCQGEIARLEEARLAVVEDRIAADLERGLAAEVAAELRQLVERHPRRERPRAQLMLALYRNGRQADALEAYAEARRVLVEELGIEPGRELQELHKRVLGQDPSLDARARPARGHHRSSGFVGRAVELAEVQAALDRATSGRGGLVLLRGEPGIGKSRLADELASTAQAQGARVLWGRCWEAGGAPAYWPWVQSLRAYVREAEPGTLRDELGAAAAYLAQLLPELRSIYPELDEPPALDADGARLRLFDAAASFLRAAAGNGPIVLVLDDLHAADEPSLLLLRYLVREIGASPLLVVCAFRDIDPTLRDPLTSALAEVLREPHTVQVALSGLREQEVGEYIERSTGEDPANRLVAAIHDETEGNPLFVGEVVRLLESEGRLNEEDAHLGIPPGVRAVIGQRIGRLSQPCRRLLVHASVLGREFALDALAQLGGIGHDDLLDVLDEAMAERVVGEAPGSAGRLRFGHALIRDTLYEELTPARRMQLHRDVGEALEAVYRDDPDPHLAELAQHFRAAVPAASVEKAVDYARRAGDRAASQLAYEEAARLYALALSLVEREPDRCDLLLLLGDARARAGDAPGSREAFAAAADLAEALGQAEHLARAALGYGGRFAWARASTESGLVPLLERALAAVGTGDSDARVRLLARLAAATRDDPLRDRRVRLADEAFEMANRIGDPVTLAAGLEGYWVAVEGPDGIAAGEGIAMGNELIRLGEWIGDKERVFAGNDHRLHGHWMLGDRAGVEEVQSALIALAEELHQPAQRWHVGTGRAMLALMEGRFEEAEALIAETRALGEQAQSWNATVTERLGLFVLRREQGRLAELEETIERSVDEYPTLLRFRGALAHLYAELGQEEEARRVFDEVMALDLGKAYVDAEWLFTMSLLADPCAFLADRDAAARIYEALLPYGHLYSQAPVEAVFGAMARPLGVVARLLGRFADAERHLEAAIELERSMRAAPWLAHAQHDLGAVLIERAGPGDEERGRELLAEATAVYERLGMNSWALRAAAATSSSR